MRPLEHEAEATSPVDDALDWHDGDYRATIETLLTDCAHLRNQLALAERAMSCGFTRGWLPQPDRDEGEEA